MKKKINSRSKGNRFETACCKLFEELVGYSFRRTRGSGAGPLKGDIAPFSENQEETLKWIQDFPLTIECKNNERVSLHNILVKPKTSFIWQSWLQAVEGSKRTGKIPFLMMKRNRYPILCMTNWSGRGTIIELFQKKHNIDICKETIFTFYDNKMGTDTTYWIFEWKKEWLKISDTKKVENNEEE